MDLLALPPHFIAFLEATKYPLLFIGSYIEGTVVMLAGGVLLKLAGSILAALRRPHDLATCSPISLYCMDILVPAPLSMRWGYVVNVTADVLEKPNAFSEIFIWAFV